MAGYSGTPLAAKLGIRPGSSVLPLAAPGHYPELVDPLPEGASLTATSPSTADLVHLFATTRSELERALPELRSTIQPAASIWVSWPKRLSKVPTDITEDVVREVALPLGLVDVKVCAVDDVWSGLKLVVRRSLR